MPTGIYLFKLNNGNTRAISEICSKLTVKTQSHVSIVDFEYGNTNYVYIDAENIPNKKNLVHFL